MVRPAIPPMTPPTMAARLLCFGGGFESFATGRDGLADDGDTGQVTDGKLTTLNVLLISLLTTPQLGEEIGGTDVDEATSLDAITVEGVVVGVRDGGVSVTLDESARAVLSVSPRRYPKSRKL